MVLQRASIRRPDGPQSGEPFSCPDARSAPIRSRPRGGRCPDAYRFFIQYGAPITTNGRGRSRPVRFEVPILGRFQYHAPPVRGAQGSRHADPSRPAAYPPREMRRDGRVVEGAPLLRV